MNRTPDTHEITITTHYLEMNSPHELRPKRNESTDWIVRRVAEPCAEFNRFLYAAVGWKWQWHEKRAWTYAQWSSYVERAAMQTWVGYWRGTPAGYFELEQQEDDDVEILYFGMLSQFVGRGLGGALLTTAIEEAWKWNASRVWLHTCSLDHPAAMQNYLARGFQKFDERVSRRQLLAPFENPW